MQLNKIFKGLVIALPVVTMMACTSTDDSAAKAALKKQELPKSKLKLIVKHKKHVIQWLKLVQLNL